MALTVECPHCGGKVLLTWDAEKKTAVMSAIDPEPAKSDNDLIEDLLTDGEEKDKK